VESPTLQAVESPEASFESAPPAEFASPYGSLPTEGPAPAPELDTADIADGIVHGEYPAPQDAPPPPPGSKPPPKVVYVQQPPPNVVYVQQPPPPPPPTPRGRATLKGGWYTYEDTQRLDDGYIISASWMQFFSPHFATEVEFGYLNADGKHNGVDYDVWGLPFMLNARFSIPVKMIELFGGAGFGSIYYNLDSSPGGGADGWVAAADTFFGATITLKSGVVLGVEGKYYFTESVHSLDGGLDAFAGMITIGIAR
jgi:hypothetical protein